MYINPPNRPFAPANPPSTISDMINNQYNQKKLVLPEIQPFLKVRKVENGYVVVKDGKEYVITEPSQIIQFFDETK